MLQAVFRGIALSGLLCLAACGGGGGGGSSSTGPNVAPVANAGPAQDVLAKAAVTLNGRASSDANGDALTYLWTLVSRPSGSAAVLTNPTSATPSFIPDIPGTYSVSLVVSDGKADSPPSSVAVNATNAAPVAGAGAAQDVATGAVVTLSGSASSDANGDSLTYSWTLTSKPTGSTASLAGATSATPTFTADMAGIYVAALVVSDGTASSSAASVNVTATNVNAAPVANAGPAQSVVSGAIVALNGSTSSDADGDALTFSWTLTAKPAGSTAVLNGVTTVRPSFTADLAGIYVASLIVNDGRISSAPSTIAVTAAAPNVAPVANVGPDLVGVTGTPVRLDGRASSDPNGDSLTYFWALVAPPGSASTLAAASTATPSFTPDIVGIYAVGLVVSDGRLNSAADTAIIAVGSPTVGPFSVSGTVFAANVSTVDSDTNDPNQLGRANNNSLLTAQLSGNPGLVVGYVNQPRTGPTGANFAAGDTSDMFRADLSAGQVVELNFADAVNSDLDLFVYDALGNLVGSSTGVSRSECVLVRRSGAFSIQVFAYGGASTYELTWAAPRPTSSCANVTPALAGVAAFVPGEIVGKPTPALAGAANTGTDSFLQSAGIDAKPTTATNVPILMRLSPTAGERATTLRTLQTGGRDRVLSAGTSAPAILDAPSDVSAATRLAFDTVVAAKLLRRSGQFAYVELNHVVQHAQVAYGVWPTNDTDLSRQPHLELIKLPQAFAALNSVSPRPAYTPIVAVVDTGVVANHPDLQRMIVPGFDFVSNQASGGDNNGIDANPDDASQPGQSTSFHGTHVAGTIAAETFNNAGMVGVAPMARIMPVRVLGVSGSGSMYDIEQGMRFAAGLANVSGTVPARRADVINLSLEGAGSCPATIADAIAAVRAQGSIVVAAAGNGSGAAVSFPANCPGAIAVSAIAYNETLASYSNVGPEIAITAPGGDLSKFTPAGRDEIWSLGATFVTDALGATSRQPSYQGLQGTSMAAPHVSGVLAIMRAINPLLTPATIDGLIAAGALTDDVGSPGRDNQFGYGRINAYKAVLATGAAPAALPSLQLSPTTLDFGVTLTELNITATRLNGSTDTPIQYIRNSLNPLAVQLFTPPGGNPAGGPFTFVVQVDRSLLAPSESVIRVQLLTQQGFSFPFDVVIAPRPVFATAQRGVGPLYVLAINADDPSSGNVSSVLAQSATPTYSYALTGVNVPRVVVIAGSDLDNDRFICGPAEPCGAYPTLGSPTVLVMTGNRVGVNFGLSSGSTSGATASFGQSGQRGFQRQP